MGSPKIKKKSANPAPASMMPRTAAIPCLVVIVLGILVLSLIVFFALSSAH